MTPSTTIQIRFDGQDVPDYVYLFHLRIKVQPYITQPMICFNCYRFGHVAIQCKKPRCRFCGEDPHESESTCPLVKGPYLCINCKGQHLVTDENCPNYTDKCLIRKIAAYINIPIKDASTFYNQEKKSAQSTNTSIDVKKLLSKQTLLPNQVPSTTPHFNYSHFPSLGNVDLDSALGTSMPLKCQNPSPLANRHKAKPRPSRRFPGSSLTLAQPLPPSHSHHHHHLHWKIFKERLDTSHRDNLHRFESSEEVLHAYDDFYRRVDVALHMADPRLGGATHRRRSYPNSPLVEWRM